MIKKFTLIKILHIQIFKNLSIQNKTKIRKNVTLKPEYVSKKKMQSLHKNCSPIFKKYMYIKVDIDR